MEIESKLLKELPGIVNWALHGLEEFRRIGLMPPKTVVNATEEYRKENDSLELFLSECCDVGKLKVCKNTDLYSTYLNFCGMSGLKPLSQTKFSPELNSRPSIKSTRNMHGITWMGIDLKKDWNPCRVDEACRVDANPTSTLEEDEEEDEEKDEEDLDPAYLRFKEGMRSHVCELCHQQFNHTLGKWYYLGENHYVCTTCQMTKPVPTEERVVESEQEVDEAQTKLEVGT